MLASGRVLVNGHRASSPTLALKKGDAVVAHVLDRRAAPSQEFDDKRVLLIDDHVIVVDKPPGIPCQSTESDPSAGLDARIQAWLVAREKKQTRVGVVHRLDTETSGVVLFGRTPEAIASFSEQFREGRVEKIYTAIVQGNCEWEQRVVDEPIGADGGRTGRFRVSPQGRSAKTTFDVVRRLGKAATVIEVRPATGRTHQIRVHAAWMGHPLLGDRKYGGPADATSAEGTRLEFARTTLHASRLTFAHPTRGTMTVSAPWPDDLAAVESALQLTRHLHA